MTWTTRPRSDLGGLAAICAGARDGRPALLLLHGVGLRAEAWAAQIDAFAERYWVIAPDLPGHGESPRLSRQASLAAYTDRIVAALSAGGAAEPLLAAGHSMGAMIALDAASRHPARIRGVAALNAIYRRAPEAAAAVRRRAAILAEAGDGPVDPSDTLTRWFGAAPSPEREACRAWLSAVDLRGYGAAYRVFAAEDGPSDAALQAIDAPALFLTGSEEPNATPSMAAAMAARAPQGRAAVIQGAAHMAPMTHAREVAAHLLDFFKECAA